MSPGARWAVAIGTLVAYDVWCDRNPTPGDSLSECIRAGFRTHTPGGRYLFVAGWAALTSWFLPHILTTALEQTVAATLHDPTGPPP